MVLMALAFYFMPSVLFSAYLTAVAVHELGHIIFLKACKLRINSLNLRVNGCVIDHCGTERNNIKLLCSLAGPGMGLIFAFVCSGVSKAFDLAWLDIFAGFSLALSIFNLLPCIPLDGASVVDCLLSLFISAYAAKVLLLATSLVCGLGLIGFGIYITKYGYGYGLVAVGASLSGYILFEEGIVKIRKMR